MGPRLARLLLVLLVALACCACTAGDPVIELNRWTLVAPSGDRRPVTLPIRFSDADLDSRSHATLETTTTLPASWGTRPATLGLTASLGDVRLFVNGNPVPCDRLGLSLAWAVRPDWLQSAPVTLHLDVDGAAAPMVGSPLRLSSTPSGDARFNIARHFNFYSSVIGTSITVFISLLYATLFLLDRRRSAHGWFAVQATATIATTTLHMGGLQLLSPWMLVALIDCALTAVVTAECFRRSYLRRPQLGRRWMAALAVVAAATAIPHTPGGRLGVAQVGCGLVLAGIVWQIVLNVREARRGSDAFASRTLAATWVLLAICTSADVCWLLGMGEIWGGLKLVEVGPIVYSAGQALILGRDHVRSLADAEARVRDLEAQRREVDELNEELRRQVAERSRELTEALARSEGSVAPAALDVGDVFDGRYRVVRSLGRGGMGAVYEVQRTRDGKRLALKVVTGAMSAKHAARFAREAEIGARLQHQNLVSIVDVGIAAGATPFLVMELVQDGSLEDKRARFGDATWALPIVRQIAAGLAELHANRIVHRDLKPGNVLLVENGTSSSSVAKISDFGISRFGAIDDSGDVDPTGATAQPGAPHASPRDLTETGAIMGTPVYMPPEAWFGPAKHPSADVFSLGVLAYEALTGRSPFPVPPVLLVRARQPIPAPAPLDGIDDKVASLVLGCLRVEPSERPRAKEVAEAL